MNNDLTDLQREVVDWINKNFPPGNRRNDFIVTGGLAEEASEVLRAGIKLHQKIRGTEEQWITEIRKEVGDVFIKLIDVADWYGFDLFDAIRARWEVIKTRDWNTDPKGHGITPDAD